MINNIYRLLGRCASPRPPRRASSASGTRPCGTRLAIPAHLVCAVASRDLPPHRHPVLPDVGQVVAAEFVLKSAANDEAAVAAEVDILERQGRGCGAERLICPPCIRPR
jgi:hypothetical protein